jgi:hypothetical protein
MPLAAPFDLSGAAFSFAPLMRCAGSSVVRTYLSPVGRAHHANQYLQHLRARPTGFYHGVGSRAQPGSDPSLCATPMPQSFSYVHVSGLGSYIRKQMPIRAPAGLSRVQSKPLPGRARISHPPARPDLFLPNVGEEEFSEVRTLPWCSEAHTALEHILFAHKGICCLRYVTGRGSDTFLPSPLYREAVSL